MKKDGLATLVNAAPNGAAPENKSLMVERSYLSTANSNVKTVCEMPNNEILTRMVGHDNEDRGNHKCHVDLVFFNVGTELDGIEAWHDHNSNARGERELQKLDSTCQLLMKR
jgi:hypothetical protein